MKNLKMKKRQQGALLAVEYALLLCMIVAGYIASLPEALTTLWNGIQNLFTQIARIIANCGGDRGGDRL